jgi:hypothetical protein
MALPRRMGGFTVFMQASSVRTKKKRPCSHVCICGKRGAVVSCLVVLLAGAVRSCGSAICWAHRALAQTPSMREESCASFVRVARPTPVGAVIFPTSIKQDVTACNTGCMCYTFFPSLVRFDESVRYSTVADRLIRPAPPWWGTTRSLHPHACQLNNPSYSPTLSLRPSAHRTAR